MELIGSFIGGIGLFLLGMKLMSDGLRLAAGRALRHILERWTRTPLHSFFSGVLITSLVQSSSAVTVAAIGFANAGLLSLLQTSYVIYGTNIGTTMTGWLVAMVGFKLEVQALALPLIGAGIFLRLLFRESRRGALGESLSGFGLFFLGVAILRDAFGELALTFPLPEYTSEAMSLLWFVAAGFLLTLLMQSSSAAMAITLSAAASGVLSLDAAAATVVGANVGTTATAALAVIGATPNAQRTAAIHVLFNVITAAMAMLLLPQLLELVTLLHKALEMPLLAGTILALFHTLFNVTGVLLLWFVTPALVRWLQQRLRSAEEDRGRPIYLDNNIVATPALALGALLMELQRMGEYARSMLRDLLSSERAMGSQMHTDRTAVVRLENAINQFSVAMQRTPLPEDISQHLPQALRVSRYYEAVSNLAVEAAAEQELLDYIELPAVAEAMGRFRQDCVGLLALLDTVEENEQTTERVQAGEELMRHYETLKAALLRAGSAEQITLPQMLSQLDLYSKLRRAVEQALKGAVHQQELTALASRYHGDTISD